MNFVKVNKIDNNHLLERNLFNPDGIEQVWVLSNKKNDKHVALMAIYKEDSNSIEKLKILLFILDKHNISFIMPDKENIVKENINDCKVFNELFENVSSNNYHPNEISAELISIYYLQKMDLSHYHFDNKGLRKLESWFKNEVF